MLILHSYILHFKGLSPSFYFKSLRLTVFCQHAGCQAKSPPTFE